MLPFIHIGDHLVIPTYFLVISLAYTICLIWGFYRAEGHGLSQKIFLDFSLIVMGGGFIGSRLFHVFYEMPDYYLRDPVQILYFWHGGFVFYGGVLGAAVPSFFYLKSKKVNILEWLNFLTPLLALGYIMGRFATLLSGSGYGLPTQQAWGIIYPINPEAPAGIRLHPTPIYSMLWNSLFLLSYFIFNFYYNREVDLKKSVKPKFAHIYYNVFFIFLFWQSLGRLIIEQFRSDFRGWSPAGLSISSWLSLSLILFSIYMIFKNWPTKLFKQVE